MEAHNMQAVKQTRGIRILIIVCSGFELRKLRQQLAGFMLQSSPYCILSDYIREVSSNQGTSFL